MIYLGLYFLSFRSQVFQTFLCQWVRQTCELDELSNKKIRRRNWFIWTFMFCCKFDDVTIRLVHRGKGREESLVMAANCSNYAVPCANLLPIWWGGRYYLIISPTHSIQTEIISLNLYLWLIIHLSSFLTDRRLDHSFDSNPLKETDFLKRSIWCISLYRTPEQCDFCIIGVAVLALSLHNDTININVDNGCL